MVKPMQTKQYKSLGIWRASVYVNGKWYHAYAQTLLNAVKVLTHMVDLSVFS